MDNLKLDGRTRQIYNIDETSISLDPSKTKVVGEVNKSSSRIVSGPGRENTTVLFGANADCEKLPPLIVFKGKNIWDSWVACEEILILTLHMLPPPMVRWRPKFFSISYMKNTFLKNCVLERPVLLILMGILLIWVRM